MRLLHYLEIQNFKHFGERQRIELDHPTVLIGPNNCGTTTAIQAIALWSQAVKTWYEAKGQSRPKDVAAIRQFLIDLKRCRYTLLRCPVEKPFPEFGNPRNWIVVSACIYEDVGVQDVEQVGVVRTVRHLSVRGHSLP